MKIFVGHSFADRDKTLVDSIISFLAKKGISCQTGEPAQNKSVSEKVKALIDGNEVFLGIFTVDQQIKQLEEEKILLSFNSFSLTRKTSSKINLPIFTTSNWVLQESGYAIAKDKKIILMVENGINRFPELQGNLEIIPFNRGSLDKPFLKLIEMLFDGFQLGHTGTQTTPSSTEAKEDSKQEEIKPAPFMKMFDAFEQKDMKKVEEIYQQEVKPTLSNEQKTSWDAIILRWQYSAGEANKFSELERLYDETKDYNVGVQLGLCLEDFDKYKEAREVYAKCLQNITDDKNKLGAYLRIANCYLGEKDYSAAIKTLLELEKNPAFSQGKEIIFLDLIKVAEANKDDYLYFVFAEKALDINPVNTDLRFNIAFKYSNTNKNDLALYHYKKLLEIEENDMGLNNIGVAYSELDMEAKGIKFYEKASRKKITLAYANLANKYLNAGFTDTAEKLLIEADGLSSENVKVHENIGYSKKALKDKVETEDKKETEVLVKATQAHNFRIRHSEAFCASPNPGIDFSGKWMLGEWGEIEIKWNSDGSFSALSSKDYEVPAYGLGLGFAFALQETPATTIRTRVVEINGTMHNLAGKFTLLVRDGVKGATSTLLSSGLDEIHNSSGLLIMNVSGNSMDVMEEVKNKERTYNQYKKA